MNIYEYFWGVIADIVVVIVGLMLRGMFCYAAFEDVQSEVESNSRTVVFSH